MNQEYSKWAVLINLPGNAVGWIYRLNVNTVMLQKRNFKWKEEQQEIVQYNSQLLICVYLHEICFADVAVEREVEGDLFLHDVGQGLCFKPGTFDGCIR